MAIEIKGLRSDALLARANIDRVRAAYARFNQAAPAHADDVDKLASDITGMQSDLEFAATVMGNSDGASGVSQKPPVVRQNIQAGVGDLNQPKVAPEASAAAFVATADKLVQPVLDRVALGDLNLPGPVGTRVALGPHPDQPEGQQSASQQPGSASAHADPGSSGADVLVRAAE